MKNMEKYNTNFFCPFLSDFSTYCKKMLPKLLSSQYSSKNADYLIVTILQYQLPLFSFATSDIFVEYQRINSAAITYKFVAILASF